ncbi:ferritin-like domain-containing protein [Lentinula aciculospora]|uniref:Ferritin-like domain-containing protein n=1 Tax=Lentinula aciculospora TaxID=153920 RepID=A0A9W9A9F4_9AGAR|nr:ferritin-like domain-containing protein [Lentinula aciculospora]
MKFTSLIAYASLISAASASAVPKVSDSSTNSSTVIGDATILNFLLIFENLENALYTGALGSFTQDDFINDGLPTWSRGRFEQISAHEQAIVASLSDAVGSNAIQACNYSLPYTSPSSFTELAEFISGVSVAAHLGVSQYNTNSETATIAASVLSTKARHAAWIAAPVNKHNAWSGAFDTPLSFNVAYTLAAQYMSGCPSTNPSLPFTAYPSLTIANATAGQSAAVSAASNVTIEGQYIAFFSGLSTTFVQVQEGQVVIPNDSMGISYAVLTSSKSLADDSTIMAGVAAVQVDFNSYGLRE